MNTNNESCLTINFQEVIRSIFPNVTFEYQGSLRQKCSQNRSDVIRPPIRFNKFDSPEIKSNKLLVLNLPDWLYQMSLDHAIYYVTFTFKNCYKVVPKSSYIETLSRIWSKMNCVSVNSRKRKPSNKLKMILLPELSQESMVKNFVKPHHYHGYIAVRYADEDKFCRKCLSNNNALLDQIVIDPKLTLAIHTTHISKIAGKNEFRATAAYNGKNLVHPYIRDNVSSEDVLFFVNETRQQNPISNSSTSFVVHRH